MIYDYDVYFRQNCIVPLCLAIFSLVWFIGFLVSFIKERVKPLKKESVMPPVVIFMLFLFVAINLISVNIIPLYRGGIYLLFEKETDQIQVSGDIEDTMEIDSYGGAKYDTENNHGYGEIIVVNGEKYYLTTYGDFGVGDNVILNVLPKSGFVLKMVSADAASEDDTENGENDNTGDSSE